jgi:hypothetical protein
MFASLRRLSAEVRAAVPRAYRSEYRHDPAVPAQTRTVLVQMWTVAVRMWTVAYLFLRLVTCPDANRCSATCSCCAPRNSFCFIACT